MAVQFGAYNFDTKPLGEKFHQACSTVAAYAPDLEGSFCKENFGIFCRAFHTTKESHAEVQPLLTKAGHIIVWDGRLDNRKQLIQQLAAPLPGDDDLAIVAAAYELWGTGCFAKLIGDWAVSICDPKAGCIILAKDFIGTRPLYYVVEKEYAAWSSVLEGLLVFAGHTFDLNGEYIAGLLSLYPAAHLTPYCGIHSVPAACFVQLSKGSRFIAKYWDFDPSVRIRYRSDVEYEQQFLTFFRESVVRRLRASTPVLAELSGGIDSSAIVCTADELIRAGLAETQGLDTVSYYDDAEPDWDERPYFTLVEKKRRRTGCHIQVGAQRDGIATASSSAPLSETSLHQAPPEQQFEARLRSGSHRVLLSGTGGDEVTGGVPSQWPELADLLVQARFTKFRQQMESWALHQRKPCLHLLLETLSPFFHPAQVQIQEALTSAPWLTKSFRQRYERALTGYPRRIQFFGGLPSFQENLVALDTLRRQLGCSLVVSRLLCEKRYPFLDRDLLEFLYAVPREQLIRPGQRRSLLRRALAGLVPDEILNRKRKARVSRRPLAEISARWTELANTNSETVCASLGIVDERQLRQEILKAEHGLTIHSVTLVRLLSIERWLRGLRETANWSGVVRDCSRPRLG